MVEKFAMQSAKEGVANANALKRSLHMRWIEICLQAVLPVVGRKVLPSLLAEFINGLSVTEHPEGVVLLRRVFIFVCT